MVWSNPQRPFVDGLLAASCVGLVMIAIAIVVGPTGLTTAPQCQEVVIEPKLDGQVWARCPTGTHAFISEGVVVCRCPTDGQQPLVVPSKPDADGLRTYL